MGENKQAYWSVLTAFVLVFFTVQSVTYLTVVETFQSSAQSAGLVLLLRTLPSFFTGWLTGIAADFHATKWLNLSMFILLFVTLPLPTALVLLPLGVVMSWAEISVGTLLSEVHDRENKAVHIGFAYDIGKFTSVAGAFALYYLPQAKLLLLAVAAVGVYILKDAYYSRRTAKKTAWKPDFNIKIITAAAAINAFGVGSFMWVQGYYSANLNEFLIAAGIFSVSAILGNVSLMYVKKNYTTATLGAAVMFISAFCVSLAGGEFIQNIGYAFSGFGAAVLYQSLRSILMKRSFGRDQAMFTTSIRVAVAAGAICLSAALSYNAWIIILTALTSTILTVWGALKTSSTPGHLGSKTQPNCPPTVLRKDRLPAV